uniref:Uncharacterized protein n=1 Tax=Picea sitchensis TaxID=3332 RepID=A9NRH7_PICSI|nr:unknown [Picea sitchensis]
MLWSLMYMICVISFFTSTITMQRSMSGKNFLEGCNRQKIGCTKKVTMNPKGYM